MIKGIIPKITELSPEAICVMIYDWENPVGSELLDIIDKMFFEFSTAPAEATGCWGTKHSHGRYSRVRKKIASFLDGNLNGDQFSDVRVLSEKLYEKDEPFCPSAVGVAWASGGRKNKKAIFYIRADSISDSELFVQYIENELFPLVGNFYGGVWRFPVALGPESYLSSIVSVKRNELKPEPEYGQRITQWRDNLYKGLYSRDGYLREVYPINYINKNHINTTFNGSTLGHFMELHGSIKKCSFNSDMYRWDIPKNSYTAVVNLLESSGLVLSAPIR